ncbi:MAG: guanylyltransferase [Blastocatellia bacterium]|nr:guanylyltransferase [Blastocatellia bacterium]
MKFEDLDTKMRVFETAHDQYILPKIFIVIRLDGRGFTRQTKDVWKLEIPFDTQFRDIMLATTEHLFEIGFSVVYGYTQSDEISILLRRDDATFSRKVRKLISVTAGEASSHFTLSMGKLACFDARICQLPTESLVHDYFRWRQEDAHRNALNAHCYWLLRRSGKAAQQSAKQLMGLSVSEKNELLFQSGINFNDLPLWQKRGAAVYVEDYQKPALNPKTGESVLASRRRLKRDLELPMGEQYGDFIDRITASGVRV